MMEAHTLSKIEAYAQYLAQEERSCATIEKYLRDAKVFLSWLGDRPLDKLVMLAYKESLMEKYAAVSVNSMLAAVNGYLKFINRPECTVKSLKTQRRLFCPKERELTKAEYLRLVEASKRQGNMRLSMVMQTICATGIRVSELEFITVDAVHTGRSDVRCKGKQRTVFLPRQLCHQLAQYKKDQGIVAGPIFVTKGGRPMDRSNIWAEMKRLCKEAGVAESKVFPHNLRHLFARTFYSVEKDIIQLADLLGHSSIETTRIYMISTGSEHMRKIDRMGLILQPEGA